MSNDNPATYCTLREFLMLNGVLAPNVMLRVSTYYAQQVLPFFVGSQRQKDELQRTLDTIISTREISGSAEQIGLLEAISMFSSGYESKVIADAILSIRRGNFVSALNEISYVLKYHKEFVRDSCLCSMRSYTDDFKDVTHVGKIFGLLSRDHHDQHLIRLLDENGRILTVSTAAILLEPI